MPGYSYGIAEDFHPSSFEVQITVYHGFFVFVKQYVNNSADNSTGQGIGVYFPKAGICQTD
jgi:hypothetical protein